MTALRSLLAIALCVVVVGCGSSQPAKATQQLAQEKPWNDLKAKMDTMTPEQRAKYIQEHPDEISQLGRT